jgi:hypothetical protein
MPNVTMIEQIQRDALNADVPVSTLLMKVKLAAAKLGLPKIEGWVDKELKGYNQKDETPEYRLLRGVPGARGPHHNWQPLVVTDAEFAERFSIAHIGTPIPGIESQIRTAPKAALIFQYPPALAVELNRINCGQISQCGVLFNAQQLVPIVEMVRTLVLEWSIEMERAGITGSDVSFSEDEKHRAQTAPVTIHIGQIGAFTGNLGVGNNAADVTSSPLHVESVEHLLNQIKSHGATLSTEGLDGDDLLRRVATIETELRKPAPNHSVIKSLLDDLRTVVRGSVQGLASTGLLSLLNQILGTCVPAV